MEEKHPAQQSAKKEKMPKITAQIKEVCIKTLVSNDKAVRIVIDCANVTEEMEEILAIAKTPPDQLVKIEIEEDDNPR
jgi:hypothetical protein